MAGGPDELPVSLIRNREFVHVEARKSKLIVVLAVKKLASGHQNHLCPILQPDDFPGQTLNVRCALFGFPELR